MNGRQREQEQRLRANRFGAGRIGRTVTGLAESGRPKTTIPPRRRRLLYMPVEKMSGVALAAHPMPQHSRLAACGEDGGAGPASFRALDPEVASEKTELLTSEIDCTELVFSDSQNGHPLADGCSLLRRRRTQLCLFFREDSSYDERSSDARNHRGRSDGADAKSCSEKRLHAFASLTIANANSSALVPRLD